MNTESAVSLILAALALGVSVVTAWLTLLRRGDLKMTRPALVFFGFDPSTTPSAKVYLRMLLYCSAARGRMVETLWLRVRTGQAEMILSRWAYGERSDLSPGSGLFVGQDGVTLNHHFLPVKGSAILAFSAGVYTIEVLATTAGRHRAIVLGEMSLTLAEDHAAALKDPLNGVFFHWLPEENRYEASLDTRRSDATLFGARRGLT